MSVFVFLVVDLKSMSTVLVIPQNSESKHNAKLNAKTEILKHEIIKASEVIN